MDALIRVLEQECRSLEQLRYRASVAVLLLRAGEGRFLPRVADELHAAVDQLSQVELLRATVLADLAGDDGEAPTLTSLIARSPTATASRLRELQDRLRAALTELRELTGAGTVVAAMELETIRRNLGRWSGVGSPASGYGATPALGPARFDRSV